MATEAALSVKRLRRFRTIHGMKWGYVYLVDDQAVLMARSILSVVASLMIATALLPM